MFFKKPIQVKIIFILAQDIFLKLNCNKTVFFEKMTTCEIFVQTNQSDLTLNFVSSKQSVISNQTFSKNGWSFFV